MNGFKVTILPDGRVKVEAGSFSGPLHTTAEKFLADMLRMLGGDVTYEGGAHSHHHGDGQDHIHIHH